ncbi:FeoB-associated Cys-rich membrane protein [Clostridium intestinale]|nr:FeoB-associated Cys-rich membrane protein [Clostridium intestinale]
MIIEVLITMGIILFSVLTIYKKIRKKSSCCCEGGNELKEKYKK